MATPSPADSPPFGELLRRLRVAAGLTQEALAERAGLSTRGLSDLERGARTVPRHDTLRLLIQGLAPGPTERAALIAAAAARPRLVSGRTATAAASRFSAAELPVPADSLIGREHEIAAVLALVRDPSLRLITLTGPGGVGKTRLALAVAAQLQTDFPGGVGFVSLASIRSAALVLPAIAQALSIRESPGCAPEQAVAMALRGQQVLVVLDNLEQALDAAPGVGRLLAAAPDLRLLVTSRAPLRLSSEQRYPVPPLPTPDLSSTEADEDLPANPAVRLFVRRSRQVQPDFTLTTDNALPAATICRRLDGLPLAIELAAARVAVLPPSALLTRLERALPLLSGGARDQPKRQQTMRAAIAWSYDLLSPDEQTLFRRLAIFVSGFTLEAAEHVVTFGMADVVSVLDGIAALVDRSLLHQTLGPDGEPRFRMLETIREFASERLAESLEADAVADRHARFCVDFAERLAPEGLPGDRDVALDRVAAEHDNLRAAFERLCQAGIAEDCLRLAAACAPFWYARGHIREGWDRLQRALTVAASPPTAAKGRVLIWASQLAITSGDCPAASIFAQEALAVWDVVGDPAGHASALNALAMVEEIQLHWDAAAALYDQVLEAWRQLDEPFHLGRALAFRAGVAFGQGDLAVAVALADEAGVLFRQLGNRRQLGLIEWYLGMFAASQGRQAEAARHYRESLRALVAAGDSVWLFKPVAGLAAVATQCDHVEPAALLVGTVDALLQRTGARLLPFDVPIYETAHREARAILGETAFATARQAGRDLSVEALFAEADTILTAAAEAARAPRRRGAPALSALTRREHEVLRLLAQGKTDREIAERLFVSRRTVNAHVANILGQFGVHSRQAAVERAQELGLLRNAPDAPRYT